MGLAKPQPAIRRASVLSLQDKLAGRPWKILPVCIALGN